MTATLPAWLETVPAGPPHPPAFVTVGGAHLYGFPSRDPDVDRRGMHVPPVTEVAACASARRRSAGPGPGTG